MISWCKNTYILWGKTRDFPYNSEKNPYFGFGRVVYLVNDNLILNPKSCVVVG